MRDFHAALDVTIMQHGTECPQPPSTSARSSGVAEPSTPAFAADLIGDEALRRESPELVAMLDSYRDGILIHRGLRYVYANAAALKLLGRAREDVVGRSPFDLVPPRFRMLLAERVMEAFSKNAAAPEVEERLLHASGTEVPVEVVDVPVTIGGSVAMLVHVRDITKRRALEIRLRAADRLASAGVIASGVTHEIAHPLSTALGDLDRLEQLVTSSSDGEVRQTLARIRASLTHAAQVARQSSLFVDDSRARAKPVDVREVLAAALAFVGSELRSRANVIECFAEVPRVLASRARLAQVFVSLLTNAIQSLSPLSRCRNDVTIGVRTECGRVLVTIDDTGVWKPHDLPCATFEPLLHARSSGTGLALALARELLAKDQGELSTESSLGAGSHFTVSLRAAPPGRERRRTLATGKRILVIDDEPRVAATLRTMLCEHRLTVARSGHEALQRLHAGEHYDLLVCDLLVESIDGIDLYHRIREEWPGLHGRIIFLTGEAFISRTQEFLAEIPNRHLQKPVDQEQLLALVDDVLGVRS